MSREKMKTALKSAVVFPQMVELRRTSHRYPELAFEEKGHWFRLMGYMARNACHKRIIAILGPDHGKPFPEGT